MSLPLTPPLPLFDRKLLGVIERVVPLPDRGEWVRNWQAELWHVHHRNRGGGSAFAIMVDLSIGLTRDALWLRTESWRRTFSGSAILCQATLFGLSVLSGLIALLLRTNSHGLAGQFDRSLVAAPLIVFVAYATAPPRHIEPGSASRLAARLRRCAFFTAKMAQVLFGGFLLSFDLMQPLHAALPNVADVLQMFSFVLVALLGMRWAFRDQDLRCKQCLHALATPMRVGRPTHNLLEWNGSEMTCKHGHGLLSVPEMETSWCESSQWIDWDEAAFS